MGGLIVAEQLIQVVWGPTADRRCRAAADAARRRSLLGDAAIEKYRARSRSAIGARRVRRDAAGAEPHQARPADPRRRARTARWSRALGYRIRRLFVGVFVAGSALAGLGGVMWGMYQQGVSAAIGAQLMVLIFIVIIIGGLGSATGCFVGALLVGLMANYVGFLAPKVALGSNILLMVAVLLWRPQGLYPVTSRGDDAHAAPPALGRPAAQPAAGGLLLVAILVGLAAGAVPLPGTRALNVAAKVCVFILLVASYDLLLGYTGIVSFAHTMFFGIGAYGVAIASDAHGPDLGGDRASASRCALAVSLVLSLADRPVLPARAGDLLRHDHARGRLGLRDAGLAAVGPHRRRGRHHLQGARSAAARHRVRSTSRSSASSLDGRLLTYYLVFVAALLLSSRCCASSTRRSAACCRRSARTTSAPRRSATAPSSTGPSPACFGALFATLAGVLLALWLRYNGPDTTLSFEIMIDILLIVVIGGMGTMYGAVIGASCFVLAQNYLQDLMKLAATAVRGRAAARADRLARPLAALARRPVRALGLLLPERRRRPAARDAPAPLALGSAHTRSAGMPSACLAQQEESSMQIRVGFEMAYRCPQPTPMLLVLNIHHSRASDLVRPDLLVTTPAVPMTAYRDLFGNWCSRIVAPAGPHRASATDALVNDSGLPDIVAAAARADAGRASARRDAGLPARQPLLRDRPAVRHRLAALRHRPDRLGPGAGDLRLRAPPHRVRLPATRATHAPPGRPTTKASASAATTRTWRSRSAAA